MKNLVFNSAFEKVKTLESKEGFDRIKIKGIAIEAGDSRNGVSYEAEELRKSAKTLKGRPIGLNHSGDVMNNVGRIKKASYEDGKLLYEAEIMNTKRNPDIIDMINNQLIDSVSIEVNVNKFEREDNKLFLRGLEFLAMDIVKVPGIKGASLSLSESVNLFYSSFQNMKMLEKTIQHIEAKETILDSDIVLVEGLLYESEDNERMKFEARVEALKARLESQDSDGDEEDGNEDGEESYSSEQVKEMLKEKDKSFADSIKNLQSALDKTRAENRKQRIVESVRANCTLSQERSIGFTEANAEKVVSFIEGLTETKEKQFFELFDLVSKVDLKRHGSSNYSTESMTEQDIAREAADYAEANAKTDSEISKLYMQKEDELMKQHGLK